MAAIHEVVSPVAPQNPIITQVCIEPRKYNSDADEEDYCVPAGFAVLYEPGIKQSGAQFIRAFCNVESGVGLDLTANTRVAGVSYDTHSNYKSMAGNYPGANHISIVCSGVVTMACEKTMNACPGEKLYLSGGPVKYGNFPGEYHPVTTASASDVAVGTFISKVGQNACQVLLAGGL